jgi:large subunit ribosomal protein L15
MKLHDLSPAPGSRKQSRRVGRGNASGRGTTAGRGTKGQKARTGHHGGPRPGFEGGQTPLMARMPKLPGFSNPNRVEYQVVNLADLAAFGAGTTVNRESLKEKGLIRSTRKPVKLLGNGALKGAVTVEVDAASASAKSAVEKAGGSLKLPQPKTRPERAERKHG